MPYMLIVMAVVGGMGFFYYKDTQAQLKTAAQEIALQKVANEEQVRTINAMQRDVKAQKEVSEKLGLALSEARNEVQKTQTKFNKVSRVLGERDIGRMAVARPKSIQRIINKGSKDAGRCFEILSGDPLTEKEKLVEKKSASNTQCPDIANPNLFN